MIIKTYTIIWRCTGDEFIFTDVDLDEAVAKAMSTDDLVLAAIEAETDDQDEREELMSYVESGGSYDLIAAFHAPQIEYLLT